MKNLPENFVLDKYGLHTRLVSEDDAEYIVKLRTDPSKNLYIHSTSSDVFKQKEWILEYKKREKEGKELYFIFSKDGENVGLARLYNIEEDKFTSGSWLVSSNVVGVGVLCDIIAREIAFELYPDSLNYFDIRKKNKSVIRYAQSYHPTLYKEDDENLYFFTDKQRFEKYKQLYLRMAKNVTTA